MLSKAETVADVKRLSARSGSGKYVMVSEPPELFCCAIGMSHASIRGIQERAVISAGVYVFEESAIVINPIGSFDLNIPNGNGQPVVDHIRTFTDSADVYVSLE